MSGTCGVHGDNGATKVLTIPDTYIYPSWRESRLKRTDHRV